MKKLIFSCAFALINQFVIAQGFTVVNSKSGNASAVLDLSNNTNNKAFLPPRVILTQLDNKINPVNNPAEGLVVYNIGTSQLKGYYIFVNGVWSLLATRENSIMNAIYENTASTNFTMSSTTFNTIGGLTLLANNSGSDISISGGNSFILKPGKYVFTVALNIQNTTTNETSIGAAVSNGSIATHAHFYTGRLWDTASNSSLGNDIELNATSNTSGVTEGRKHSFFFNFPFDIVTEKTVNFQLKRRPGGSYNGNITIINSSIIIEKSLK